MKAELCSIHTHSTLCDGVNTPEEMAAAACAAGIRHFGISCHSHTPAPLDAGATLPADMSAYRRTVAALREQYRGRMEILLGLEWDSCADVSPDGFDYWIGSVHHLRGADGGYYAIDYDAEQFAACCALFGGDALAAAEAYYARVAEVAAKKPSVLGHLDLITKLNADGRFFDESSPRYRAAALGALRAVDPDTTLLEINTGGVSRGYRELPYPAPFLLKEWRAMGGRIIITSDSHSTDTLLFGYRQAAQLARETGFDRTVLLTADGAADCPL